MGVRVLGIRQIISKTRCVEMPKERTKKLVFLRLIYKNRPIVVMKMRKRSVLKIIKLIMYNARMNVMCLILKKKEVVREIVLKRKL